MCSTTKHNGALIRATNVNLFVVTEFVGPVVKIKGQPRRLPPRTFLVSHATHLKLLKRRSKLTERTREIKAHEAEYCSRCCQVSHLVVDKVVH